MIIRKRYTIETYHVHSLNLITLIFITSYIARWCLRNPYNLTSRARQSQYTEDVILRKPMKDKCEIDLNPSTRAHIFYFKIVDHIVAFNLLQLLTVELTLQSSRSCSDNSWILCTNYHKWQHITLLDLFCHIYYATVVDKTA